MTFVSYAQNFEDLLLWRALHAVEDGFYIDLGANDPTIDSVTKSFYERGWRGINVEPLPLHHARLCEQRPRDINLAVAVGADDGVIELFDVGVRGWATTDAATARDHQTRGHDVVALTVPMRTLASICEANGVGDVHFLKIDVEGAEGDVIRGMDFERWRPWILVIEATEPFNGTPSHAEWEPVVSAHHYRFAYFDGLNRYYVAEEHRELAGALATQPNVFDDFVRFREVEAIEAARSAQVWARSLEEEVRAAEAKARDAEAKARAAEAKARDAEAKARQAEGAAQAAAAQIALISASTSWRATSPLRWLKRVTTRFAEIPGSVAPEDRSPKTYAKLAVGHPMRWLLARPTVGPAIDRRLAFVRPLDRRIRIAVYTVNAQKASQVVPLEDSADAELRELPEPVRAVLADLERALDTRSA